MVRHPAYTGALVAQVGLGVATGRSVALVASVVPPVIGYVNRIAVEERFLSDRLVGYDAYRNSYPFADGAWRVVTARSKCRSDARPTIGRRSGAGASLDREGGDEEARSPAE
jgi:Phospholipid methyltransferase